MCMVEHEPTFISFNRRWSNTSNENVPGIPPFFIHPLTLNIFHTDSETFQIIDKIYFHFRSDAVENRKFAINFFWEKNPVFVNLFGRRNKERFGPFPSA